jgi:hypothetical protein
MHIETISETVGLPLELAPPPAFSHALPTKARMHVASGRLWHLVAWSDEQSNTFGLAHKGNAIALSLKALDELTIEIMRPAKGHGWVALEAITQEAHAPVTLLQSMHFNSEALVWLLQHKSQIEALAKCSVVVNDRGSDY